MRLPQKICPGRGVNTPGRNQDLGDRISPSKRLRVESTSTDQAPGHHFRKFGGVG